MVEMVFEIVNEEIIPLAAEGIGSGFAMGALFTLVAFGISKAISLLNIKIY